MIFRIAGIAKYLVLIVLATACVGKDYSDISYDKREKAVKTSHILVQALLLDESGTPVPGINIGAQTSHSVDSDITNSKGKATLNIIIESEEPLDFHFTSKTMDWTTSLLDLPPSGGKMKITFRMDSLGRVTVATMEY
jgi:hypothetical protein